MEVEEIQANPNSTANTRSIGNGRIDDEDGGNKWQSSSSRIIRVSRATGGKDRHSKVWTSKGPRDRRVRLSVTTAIQFYDLQDRLGYDQPSKAVEWLISAASDAISELPSLNTSAFPKQDHNSSASETSKGSSVLSLSRSDVRVNRLKARQRARERASSTKDHKPQTTSSSFTELLNSNGSSCPHQLDYLSSRPHHHFHMGTSLSLPMSMSVSVPPFGIGGVDVAASASASAALEFPFVAEQQQQSQPSGGGADFGGQSFWINRGTLQSNSSHNSSHFHHHLQRLSNSANNNNNIDAHHQHQFFAAADHQQQFSAAAAAFDARLHLCYADHKGKGKN